MKTENFNTFLKELNLKQDNFPLGFGLLKQKEIFNLKIIAKIIPCKLYSTSKYEASPFYKPISKIIQY